DLAREALVGLDDLGQVLRRDEEYLVRYVLLCGDEVQGVPRLDIVGVDDADLEHAVLEANRGELVVGGGLLGYVVEHLERDGGVAEGARRYGEELAARGEDLLGADAGGHEGLVEGGAGRLLILDDGDV